MGLSFWVLSQKPLSLFTTKPTDSHFWKGLMRVKGDFMHFGSFFCREWRIVKILGGQMARGNALSSYLPLIIPHCLLKA